MCPLPISILWWDAGPGSDASVGESWRSFALLFYKPPTLDDLTLHSLWSFVFLALSSVKHDDCPHNQVLQGIKQEHELIEPRLSLQPLESLQCSLFP